jgi:ribosomal protein S18 acetylase RimI-like enzyme
VSDSFVNRYKDEHGQLEAVEDFSIFDGFSCGHSGIDNFLFNHAEKNQKELLLRVYSYRLMLDTGVNPTLSEPVAYVSMYNSVQNLDSGDIDDKGLNGVHAKDFNRSFPSVTLCNLAVKLEYQRNSIGTNILNLVKRIFITNNKTGCRFISIQSIGDPGIVNFYMKNDFEPTSVTYLSGDTVPMFCDLLRFKNIAPPN